MQEVDQQVELAFQPRILDVVVVCVSVNSRADNQVAAQEVEVAPQAYFLGEAAYFHRDTRDMYLDTFFLVCASSN